MQPERMRAFHRPGLCAILAALLWAGNHAAAQDLQTLAREVIAHDTELGALWPGFWPEGQPFLLYSGNACVLRSRVAPQGDDFVVLDAERHLWAGRCADAMFRGPMVLDKTIAGIKAPAVRIDASRSEASDAISFLLHEAFHAFQTSGFTRIERVETDYTFAREMPLVRMKLRETSFLLSAADSTDRNRQIALVRAAVANREARLAGMPAAARAVEDYFLRSEGTAQYIDVRTSSLIDADQPPAHYIQHALRQQTRGLGRTWEYLLRWQSYATGAAAGLLLDQWQVDWKPHVVNGKPVFEILAIASGYDPVEQAALLDASGGADNGGMFKTARRLLENDRIAEKALYRYGQLADFTLEVEDDDPDATGSFGASEVHTVAGGVVVMDPSPYNAVSSGFDLRVERRPLRHWWRDEDDPQSRGRLHIALPRPPTLDGCEAEAIVCGAGTRLSMRGLQLELKREFSIERGDDRWTLRPLQPLPSGEQTP